MILFEFASLTWGTALESMVLVLPDFALFLRFLYCDELHFDLLWWPASFTFDDDLHLDILWWTALWHLVMNCTLTLCDELHFEILKILTVVKFPKFPCNVLRRIRRLARINDSDARLELIYAKEGDSIEETIQPKHFNTRVHLKYYKILIGDDQIMIIFEKQFLLLFSFLFKIPAILSQQEVSNINVSQQSFSSFSFFFFFLTWENA